jgi:hypothetical protein
MTPYNSHSGTAVLVACVILCISHLSILYFKLAFFPMLCDIRATDDFFQKHDATPNGKLSSSTIFPYTHTIYKTLERDQKWSILVYS